MEKEDFEYEAKRYITNNLSLNVKEREYQSGTGPYESVKAYTIQLVLDGEIISEEYLEP